MAKQPRLRDELNDIIDRLSRGEPLPRRYYRAGINATPDQLLQRTGIKHLHLGGQDSDVLLYAVEYPDQVVLLQINTHIHFRSKPVGRLLESLFGLHLSKTDAAVLAAGATAIASTLAKSRKRWRKKQRPPES